MYRRNLRVYIMQPYDKYFEFVLIFIPKYSKAMQLKFQCWGIIDWKMCKSEISVVDLYDAHPIFFIEYLTQNVIFHVKSHVTKHEFWGLLILKSQHPMLPNLTWNETWNDTSLKKSGGNWKELRSWLVCYFLEDCPGNNPFRRPWHRLHKSNSDCEVIRWFLKVSQNKFLKQVKFLNGILNRILHEDHKVPGHSKYTAYNIPTNKNKAKYILKSNLNGWKVGS